MIRPSLLDRAEMCALVPKLAEDFPETSDVAARGNVVDGESTVELLGGVAATDPDARASVDWFAGEFGEAPMPCWIKEMVALMDPATGELLTEGTPDAQVLSGSNLTTVDLKKREQFYAGHLAGPDDNLQLSAYSVARGLECGAERYRNVLLLFGDGEVEAIASRSYERAEWWAVIERIRAIQAKKPEANPGPHCGGCYSKLVCPSYRERARLALSLIEEDAKSIALTDDTALALLERAEAVEAAAELAKKLVREYVKGGGKVEAGGKRYGAVIQKGRRTADVAALEAAGLTQYVRQGAPHDQWRWLKVR